MFFDLGAPCLLEVVDCDGDGPVFVAPALTSFSLAPPAAVPAPLPRDSTVLLRAAVSTKGGHLSVVQQLQDFLRLSFSSSHPCVCLLMRFLWMFVLFASVRFFLCL